MEPPSQRDIAALRALPQTQQAQRDLLRQAVSERISRSTEAIRLYRPLPKQEMFHASAATERIVRGGNQCTSLDTFIPSSRGLVTAAQVQVGDVVPGGTVVNRWVSPEPVKTRRLKFEGGFELVVNDEHPLLTESGFVSSCELKIKDNVKLAVGEWTWTESVMTPDDGYFAGLMTGDGCVTHRSGVMSFTNPEPELRDWIDDYLDVSTYLDSKPIEIRFCSTALKERMEHLWGWHISTGPHKTIPTEVFKDREVARQFLRGYTDTDGCVYAGSRPKERQVVWPSASKVLLQQVQQLLLAFNVYSTLTYTEKTLDGKTFDQWRLRARGPWADAFMHHVGVGLKKKRDKHQPLLEEDELPTEKWVRLKSQVHSHQKYVIGFTVDPTNTYVTAGLVSHNSGKSASAFMEVASAALGVPITGQDGNPLPFGYPRRPLKIWLIGYDEAHIGQTIYRMLFTEDNGLQAIKDRQTGKLRAYRPWDPEDAEREHECVPMPPFIPPRMLKKNSFGWKDVRNRVFKSCRLKNGTELYAFSSQAEPKQGDQVDLIHIDEDIYHPKHVAEWQARLSKRRGRMIWSAFPHSKNEALYAMSERAREQKERPHPDTFEVVLKFSENPFMPEDEKRKRLESWSDLERLARDSGEFLTHTVAMYPGFNRHIHCGPRLPPDRLDQFLEQRGWAVPSDWTRYMVVDPGHAKPAAMMAAVPPPDEFGDFVIVYDEVFIPRIDADQLAGFIKDKVPKDQRFQAFIIDFRAGRQTPAGFNKTISQQYSDAFLKHGLRSEDSGAGFIFGSDNVEAGIGLVREWMTIRRDGTCKLKILSDKCPETVRQIEAYRKHVEKDEAQDRPAAGQKDDLCDCLRYLASYSPVYVPPVSRTAVRSPAYNAFQQWKSNEKKEDYVLMGAS